MKKTCKKAASAGRPITPFNQHYADILCGEIATRPESLQKIVSSLQSQYDDFPSIPTIYRWLREEPDFSRTYDRSKQDQADIHVDEMMDIADNDTGDDLGSVAVQRAKLKVDTRKWVVSKLKPKVYGDRIIAEHTGMLNMTGMSDADLLRIVNEHAPLMIEGEILQENRPLD